jgi:hypothetical protein
MPFVSEKNSPCSDQNSKSRQYNNPKSFSWFNTILHGSIRREVIVKWTKKPSKFSMSMSFNFVAISIRGGPTSIQGYSVEYPNILKNI